MVISVIKVNLSEALFMRYYNKRNQKKERMEKINKHKTAKLFFVF